MRIIVLAAGLVAFAGCSTEHPGQQASDGYEREGSAKVPASQAEAECYAILSSPATPYQSLAQCMKSKGYAEK